MKYSKKCEQPVTKCTSEELPSHATPKMMLHQGICTVFSQALLPPCQEGKQLHRNSTSLHHDSPMCKQFQGAGKCPAQTFAGDALYC